jgi:HAD superfamily hydrolase (TIGR01490 family)
MNRPLALFDIDKTMFNGLSFFPLMETQRGEGLLDTSAGKHAQKALISYKEHTLGYEDFIKELLDAYAGGLKGKSAEKVENSTDRFFSQTTAFFGYVKPTINLLSYTHEVVLVTGSSHFTAKAVAKVFGVERYISTKLDVENGKLTGRVKSYLATRHEKKAAIAHLIEAHPYTGSFGFGDSEGDIEMLLAVEHPVCIQPTPGLAEIATKHGWAIIDDHEDLASIHGLSVVRHALNN